MLRFDILIKDILSRGFVLAKIFYSEYCSQKTKSAYVQDGLILWLGLLSLVTNVIIWIIIIQHFSFQEELVPLHYNVYFGVDVIGRKQWLFNLPLIGICIFVINFLLGWVIYKNEKVASYFLLGATLLVQIILAVAGFLILNV